MPPQRGRQRPLVPLVEFPPALGMHEVANLLLYRVPRGVVSLLPFVNDIIKIRASRTPVGRKVRRFVVIVLPYGSSRDPFAEELHVLSQRDISVSIEGEVAFTDLLAAARARVAAKSKEKP